MKQKIMVDDNRSTLYNALKIGLPAMIESLFISLLNMMDTWMVAGEGPAAVAAVGLTNQPRLMIMTIFFAVFTTCSAVVARRAGGEDREEANRTLVTSLVVSIVAYIILCGICVFFAEQIIQLCGAKTETLQLSADYFRITMAGLIFTAISGVMNAGQRGSGNTDIAMITNVAANLVNIGFNYLLIGGHFGFPALGVRGAAIATVMGSIVGCSISIYASCSERSFVNIKYIIREKIRFSFVNLKKTINMTLTLFVENLAMRLGLLIVAVVTANLGTNAFAAHQVGMSYLNLAFAFGDGLQTTAVALVGYSLGKEAIDLAKKYIKTCLLIGFSISVVISIISLFFGKQLFMLYFHQEELVAMGIIISKYFAFIVLAQLIQVICSGSLRGAGDVKYMMVTTIICVTIIQPVLAWLFAIKFDMAIQGIWLQILIVQILRLAFGLGRVLSGKWINKKV